MKLLFILLSVLSGLYSYAQSDSLAVNEYVDPCQYDTTVNYMTGKNLVWTDSSLNNYNYEFRSGSKSYFEISIKSKNCTCKDCWSHRIVIVQYDIQDSLEFMRLSPDNTVWIQRYAERQNLLEEEFDGELNLENNSLQIIKSKFPEEGKIEWYGYRIEHPLLKKP